MNNAALTNFASLTQSHSGFQLRKGTHFGTSLDHTQRANDGGVGNVGFGIDHGTGVNSNTGNRCRLFFPKLREFGEVVIRVFGHDARAAREGQFLELARHNHTGSL